jgi:hypothetical protein
MTTRKQVITEQYNTLVLQLKEYITEPVFPSLDEIDVCDLLFYFNAFFLTNDNYEDMIEGLLKIKKIDVTDEQFCSIVNLVTPFLDMIREMN